MISTKSKREEEKQSAKRRRNSRTVELTERADKQRQVETAKKTETTRVELELHYFEGRS